jgi:tetratricopeptide (TPR) repeat protein
MSRRPYLPFLFIVLLSAAVLPAQVSTTRDEAQFQELLALQQELLAQVAEAEVQEDVEKLRPRLQTLVYDWEGYLRSYPKKPDGYIAYSMLLGNPLIDERRRAKALLLRANELDPNRAIVKNQLGKYIAEDGEPLLALPYFLAAAELEPEEALYHYQIGQLLGGARSDFLTSGEWTIESIDEAMQNAFAEAVRLNPDSLPYAYRYAESYYDLENPPWDEAMAAWQQLEERVTSPVEQQMMRLHQANVLLFQGKLDEAEAMLQEPVEGVLGDQQQRLVVRLDRLRNPPPEPEVLVESTSVASEVEVASTPAAVPTVPSVQVPVFRPALPPDHLGLSSAGTVRIKQDELPPEEEVALTPETATE